MPILQIYPLLILYMLETEAPKMNPYSQINPYYLIYCNMNIRITDDITRESAQNVVRQIGYLHNAMGFVFKDLIKILSFRFPDEKHSPSPQNNPQINPKASPFHQHPPVNLNRQPMDIEFEQGQHFSKMQKPKTNLHEERKAYVEPIKRVQSIEIVEDANKQQSKPPNTNIFDEYAYSKESPAQIAKSKDLSTIKLGVAKIIEGVQRKRREVKINEGKDEKQKSDVEKSEKEKSNKQLVRRIIPNERTLPEREKCHQNSDNPMRELFSKPINPPEADIFSEFVYDNKPNEQVQPPSKPLPPSSNSPLLDRNQDESRLWQFLRQKQEPAIYEISDDQDNV